MGWKEIFKSKAKPDPRIRWFGKLPTYADYYRSPADEDWAVEFNDWILRGYEIYHNGEKERPACLPDATLLRPSWFLTAAENSPRAAPFS